jgi:hypothetical protein
MYYESLTNHELIKKLKEAENFDSTLVLCALICERAGLAERWARAAGFAVGAPSIDFDSILCLAIERLIGA